MNVGKKFYSLAGKTFLSITKNSEYIKLSIDKCNYIKIRKTLHGTKKIEKSKQVTSWNKKRACDTYHKGLFSF